MLFSDCWAEITGFYRLLVKKIIKAFTKGFSVIKQRLFFLFSFFTLLPFLSKAKINYQPKLGDPIAEDWRWTSYPRLKGQDLSHIADGADDIMWFNVDNGVYQYDGVKWEHYTSSNSQLVYSSEDELTPIFINREGIAYIGDSRGVCW